MTDRPGGAWNVECVTHGLLPTAEDKSSCPIVVAEHWLIVHGGVGAAIEGRDWISYPALQRCDVCGVPVELPAWLHHAVDGPIGEGDGVVDLTGRWLLCDACHEFFTERRLGAWVRHWMAVSRTITDYPDSLVLSHTLRVEMADRLRILRQVLDAGVRHP